MVVVLFGKGVVYVQQVVEQLWVGKVVVVVGYYEV